MTAPILTLQSLTRRYPGVVALDGAGLELTPGRVRALVGENGAGKSTLIDIVAGTVKADDGRIAWAQPGRLAVVHQHSHMLPDLTVAANFGLRHGYPRTALGALDWPRLRSACAEALESFALDLQVDTEIGQLSVVERQLAEVAFALQSEPDVLVLDEPTALLPRAETDRLLSSVADLRRRGVAILYTSHRLAEVLQLADDISVLRDGRVVAQVAAADIDEAGLIRAMVGRHVEARTDLQAPLEGVCLAADQLCPAGGLPLSFRVRAGEVFGVYGLAGAGQERLCAALGGLTPIAAGSLRLAETDLTDLAPDQRVAAGLACLPADRHQRGLLFDLDVGENLSLTGLPAESGRGGWIDRGEEDRRGTQAMSELDLRARGLRQAVGELSGGNQQKVLLGRWLRTRPRVIVLHEPTQGVDVGAKAQIHDRIRELVAGGMGVVLVSGELSELLLLSHRMAVLREDRIAGEVDVESARHRRQIPEAERAALRLALPEAAASGAVTVPRTRRRRVGGLLGAVLLLTLTAALTTPAFRTGDNLSDLLVNHSILLVGALAAAVVIISGSIDVSLGAILGLSAVAAAQADAAGWPTAAIAGAALVAGAALGWVNGALSVWGRVHAIVITLGTLSLYRGLLLQWTGGRWLLDLTPQITFLGQARILGVPILLWIVGTALLATHGLLRYTAIGQRQYAIGSDRLRAAVTGVRSGRVLCFAFAVGGLLAGLAGLLHAARYGQVQSNVGLGFELKAIAAAVIGGVHISGGRGGVGGVLLGTLLLALLANLLVLWHVSAYWDGVVVGSALLLALLSDGPLRLGRRR